MAMSEYDTSPELTTRSIPVSPDTLSLHDLVLSMAMAGHGWMVTVGLEDNDAVRVELTSNNHRKKPYELGDEAVFIEELGLKEEDGSVAEGYTATVEAGRVRIGFAGVPEERFSQTMQRLFDFSEQLGR
jgi:hypothetical protein